MFVRTSIIALFVAAGTVAGCAPAHPVVVEREYTDDPYYGYSRTVVVEEAPPPLVVVGPPVYYGGRGGYGRWR